MQQFLSSFDFTCANCKFLNVIESSHKCLPPKYLPASYMLLAPHPPPKKSLCMHLFTLGGLLWKGSLGIQIVVLSHIFVSCLFLFFILNNFDVSMFQLFVFWMFSHCTKFKKENYCGMTCISIIDAFKWTAFFSFALLSPCSHGLQHEHKTFTSPFFSFSLLLNCYY